MWVTFVMTFYNDIYDTAQILHVQVYESFHENVVLRNVIKFPCN